MMEGVLGRVAVVVICLACVAGCGGGGHSPGENTVAGAGAPVVDQTSTTRTIARVAAPSPSLIKLQSALRQVLKKAGPSSGAIVLDLTHQDVLFSKSAGVGRPPASVEKLYTTVALLRKLGPHARLRTTVLGTGHLDPGGVWHGNLYLRGGGDPTFGDGSFNRVWELGYGPTAAQLAHAVRARGIRSVTGHLYGDESFFDTRRGGPQTGYAADIPDFGGQLSALTYDHGATAPHLTPAAFAARQLARTLAGQGVTVTASARTARTPRRAHRLVVAHSPPLSVLLKLMDVPSDDLFAELLTKQLGRRFEHSGSISAGAHVISGEVAAYGLHPKIVDGSGLSRSDRTSPRQVVDLLLRVWHTSVGSILSASLPVVGVSGTVRTIATGTTAVGRCIAKTGTLDYVTNLAGYCHSRGHQLLAFAIFIDGPSNWQALVLLNPMVAAIARY